MLDFVKRRFIFFLISALILIPGIVSLLSFGLKPGIEFSSGSSMTLALQQEVEQDELRAEMTKLGYGEATIQHTTKDGFLIKTSTITQEEIEGIEKALKEEFGHDSLFLYPSSESETTTLTLVFSHSAEQARVEDLLKELGFADASVEPTEKSAFLVRTPWLRTWDLANAALSAISTSSSVMGTSISSGKGLESPMSILCEHV